jgi:hypothetical protein
MHRTARRSGRSRSAGQGGELPYRRYSSTVGISEIATGCWSSTVPANWMRCCIRPDEYGEDYHGRRSRTCEPYLRSTARFVDSSTTLRSPLKKRRGWPAFAGHDVSARHGESSCCERKGHRGRHANRGGGRSTGFWHTLGHARCAPVFLAKRPGWGSRPPHRCSFGAKERASLTRAIAFGQNDHCLPVLPETAWENRRTQQGDFRRLSHFVRLVVPSPVGRRWAGQHRAVRVARVPALVLDLIRADPQHRTRLQPSRPIHRPAIE